MVFRSQFDLFIEMKYELTASDTSYFMSYISILSFIGNFVVHFIGKYVEYIVLN